MNLEFFANDRYTVLKIMCDRQTAIRNEKAVRLNQEEIAKESHFSKQKVNKIIGELISEKYLEPLINNRSRYVLTQKAEKACNEISANKRRPQE